MTTCHCPATLDDPTILCDRHLLLCADRSRAELARLLERDERTVHAYARGRPMPAPTRVLLEILAGRMPWRGFEGFIVRRGEIYPPGLRDGVPASALPGLPYLIQSHGILRTELDRLRSAPAQYLLDLAADR